MTWPGLPLLMRVAGRPVMLLGEGEAADAKRRLLERAGASVVGEGAADARLAVVAIEDEAAAVAAVERLRAGGVLVNAVDRPELCDFTLPAVLDRSPVLVAVMTGGVSAGLAAALRQRLEAWLPAGLGRVAERLHAMRGELRARHPDASARRRAIAALLAPGGALDPFGDSGTDAAATADGVVRIVLASPDPDELTLRQARALANADRVYHIADVPAAVLDRARADAARIAGPAPDVAPPGFSVEVSMR